MRTSTTAICVIVLSFLLTPVEIVAGRGGGGGFGGGGFHGGSIGNAGNVSSRPYIPGGYSGYTYDVGPTTIEGDPPSGGGSGGSSAPTAFAGTGGGPPQQLQGGTGVYDPLGSGEADGPSWDSDWWAQDPRGADALAAETAEKSIGSAVDSLPRNYDTVYASGDRFYFSKGTFYQAAESGYQVVAPPVGIEVRGLPDAAELVTVGRQQYLLFKDIYYQALFSGSGVVYKVVEDPHS